MTKKACVIGWPIAHSRSPLIHGHWLKQYGIDGVYEKQAVEPPALANFISTMRQHGYVGCNVTVPHKERVLGLADASDDAARAIGAANTLWYEGERLHASNSDAYGFLANLDEGAPGWNGTPNAALVLGAGGAARAILHALLSRGFKEIRLANRTRARADALAADFSGPISVSDWSARSALCEGVNLIVNTTTLGMNGSDNLSFDLSAAGPDTVVTDLVYSPLQTQLLRDAAERKLRTVDGLGMLLHQAVPGFEKWFGVRPQVSDDLRSLIVRDLEKG